MNIQLKLFAPSEDCTLVMVPAHDARSKGITNGKMWNERRRDAVRLGLTVHGVVSIEERLIGIQKFIPQHFGDFGTNEATRRGPAQPAAASFEGSYKSTRLVTARFSTKCTKAENDTEKTDQRRESFAADPEKKKAFYKHAYQLNRQRVKTCPERIAYHEIIYNKEQMDKYKAVQAMDDKMSGPATEQEILDVFAECQKAMDQHGGGGVSNYIAKCSIDVEEQESRGPFVNGQEPRYVNNKGENFAMANLPEALKGNLFTMDSSDCRKSAEIDDI